MYRKSLAVAAAMATIFALPAAAADLPPLMPLPAPPPPVEVFTGGVYLRGDIGVSSQRVKEIEFDVPVPAADRVDLLHGGFDGGGFVGAGVGYRFNSWLRVDVTGEYRAPTRYSAVERYTRNDGSVFANDITTRKTEAVGLVNAYLDLGTWWGVTPFVGAGIGVAHVRLDGFKDVNVVNSVVATAPGASRTNFAWALHGGLGYDVNERLSLELAYRYLNMGKGRTGPVTNVETGFTRNAAWTFRRIDSHDVKVGMRWNLQGPSVPFHGPISRAF